MLISFVFETAQASTEDWNASLQSLQADFVENILDSQGAEWST